ncbi:MAG: hypothetical protein ACOY90_15730 [Candidatus Zhuqueibacterota bacterium]
MKTIRILFLRLAIEWPRCFLDTVWLEFTESNWDALELASGVYLNQLESGEPIDKLPE